MISFVTDWLKEIIAVLLLAVFLDLILPNSSMQRYVKLVMGLLILMTMLSPVLKLFDQEFSVQQLSMEAWGPSTREQQQEKQVLHQYQQQLQNSQEKWSQHYVKEQVTAMVKQKVESSYPVEVTDVSVNVTFDPLRPAETAELASLYIALQQKNEIQTKKEEDSSIQPVEPVVIQAVDFEKQREPPHVKKERQASSLQNEDQHVNQIKKDIQQMLYLSPEQVQVSYEAG